MDTDMKYKDITDIILKSFYEVEIPEFKRFIYSNERKNISDNLRKSAAERLRG